MCRRRRARGSAARRRGASAAAGARGRPATRRIRSGSPPHAPPGRGGDHHHHPARTTRRTDVRGGGNVGDLTCGLRPTRGRPPHRRRRRPCRGPGFRPRPPLPTTGVPAAPAAAGGRDRRARAVLVPGLAVLVPALADRRTRRRTARTTVAVRGVRAGARSRGPRPRRRVAAAESRARRPRPGRAAGRAVPRRSRWRCPWRARAPTARGVSAAARPGARLHGDVHAGAAGRGGRLPPGDRGRGGLGPGVADAVLPDCSRAGTPWWCRRTTTAARSRAPYAWRCAEGETPTGGASPSSSASVPASASGQAAPLRTGR